MLGRAPFPRRDQEAKMRRVILAAAALAMPIAAATTWVVATAGTAGASAPGSCTKLSGNVGTTITRKGCGGGLGKGSAAGVSLTTGGTIVGKGNHNGSTTVGNVSVTSPGQGSCAATSTEEDFTGTVTADTSKANLSGTTVSGSACVDGSGNISLVKHTRLSL
jgi:hypothetical protein